MKYLMEDPNLCRVIAVRTGKTVYRYQDYAVKVFDEDYSKADVLNEALNQARVEETELDIPRIVEVTKIEGKWAIVTEFIKGKTLATLMEEDSSRFGEYLQRFIELQIRVHSMKAPLLNKLSDKMVRKICQTDLSATARYELHMRLDSMPRGEQICHGDFNPSNIICCEDGRDYIIDWSHATQGPAAADAARTYLLFWLSGQIEGSEAYLDSFCQSSGVSKQLVQKWLPIVAASQSVKGRPEEREFLLHWVNVADYE